MASQTFRRLAVAYPDRVGHTGISADLDGYRIAVVDMGRDCLWSLSYNDQHITSGRSDPFAPALAWLDASHALDAHRAALAEADQ